MAAVTKLFVKRSILVFEVSLTYRKIWCVFNFSNTSFLYPQIMPGTRFESYSRAKLILHLISTEISCFISLRATPSCYNSVWVSLLVSITSLLKDSDGISTTWFKIVAQSDFISFFMITKYSISSNTSKPSSLTLKQSAKFSSLKVQFFTIANHYPLILLKDPAGNKKQSFSDILHSVCESSKLGGFELQYCCFLQGNFKSLTSLETSMKSFT